MAALTKEQMHYIVSTPATKELVNLYESLAQSVSTLVDIKKNPMDIYDPDVRGLVVEHVMSTLGDTALEAFESGTGETVFMEGFADDEVEPFQQMSVPDAHRHNLKTMLENSLKDGLTQMSIAPNANHRNVNELTPLDAFIPMVIVRSYLPLCGKDLIPYIVPKMDFIRFKEVQKWVITKDGTKYRRPDVYGNKDAVQDIIASGKGRRVTKNWFPLGQEVTGGDPENLTGTQYADEDGVVRTIPTDGLRLENLDLLVESGGDRNIGDALSHDVYVCGARGIVTIDGTEYVVENMNVNGYYDVTAYTPQRSIQADITYHVHISDDAPEETVTDRIYGSYDAESASFELVSMKGITRQVMFGGNLSNKNNREYISFGTSFSTYQHTIGEGMRSNFPISFEDVQLYRDTANIDIVANAVNEMTDIFIQLEDTDVVGFFDRCFRSTKNVLNHGGIRFTDSIVTWQEECDLTYSAGQYFKINESNQDRLQYALSTMLADISDVCGNEDFRAIMACHPNVARLFVGESVDWKITRGQAVSSHIRTDYDMGVYTAQGDSMKLVTTKKYDEAWGVNLIVYPVNEENYQTWKHFKRGIYFDRNHHVEEMRNNPNIMGVAMFQSHAYIPFQTRLIPTNYRTIKAIPRFIIQSMPNDAEADTATANGETTVTE